MRAFILIVFLAGAVATTTSAQLSLDWWTVNGGGGTSVSTDGRFELSGTAGQPDALRRDPKLTATFHALHRSVKQRSAAQVGELLSQAGSVKHTF